MVKNCSLRAQDVTTKIPSEGGTVSVTGCGIVDKLNPSSEWVPYHLNISGGKFKTDKNNSAFVFDGDNGFINMNSDDSYNFGKDNFTICVWVQFIKQFGNNAKYDVVHPRFIVQVTPDVIANVDIAEIVPDTEWHFYSIVRIDDNIRLYVDGKLVYTLNTTEDFNLDTTSFVYIGHCIENCTGNPVNVDDIYIFRHLALWNTSSFTIPTNYQQTENFFYSLFTQNNDNLTFAQSYNVKYIEDKPTDENTPS